MAAANGRRIGTSIRTRISRRRWWNLDNEKKDQKEEEWWWRCDTTRHEDVQQPSRRALVPSLGLPLADLVCSVRPADMFAIGQERKQKEKDEVEDQSDDDDDDNAAAAAAVAAAEEEEGDVFGKNW
jgi:hypothetical protein